jgi:predicted hydrocarbon binding protein
MEEFDLIVACEQRHGLVFELATLLMGAGFRMLTQHALDNTPTSAVFALRVRGNSTGVGELQKRLQGAKFIQRVEFAHTQKQMPSGNTPTSNFANAAPSLSAAPAPRVLAVDQVSVEQVLPKIATSYPNFFPMLERVLVALPANTRADTAFAIGVRVGAWVFKRDFALGARLEMQEFVRRVIPAASKAMLEVQSEGLLLSTAKSPFAKTADSPQCQFFSGFFSGLACEAKNLGNVQFEETQCRAMGAPRCVFKLSHH